MMSSPKLSPQTDPGCQQQTAQPPDALAPGLASSPQSTVYVRVQSLPPIGQGVGGSSVLCQHFAEVCTSTYDWIPISEADAQKLVALKIPSQVVFNEVPSDVFPSNDVESEQRWVFKTSKHHSQMV
jgi:hypothetical protein